MVQPWLFGWSTAPLRRSRPSSEPPLRGPGPVLSLSLDQAAKSGRKLPLSTRPEKRSSYIPDTTPPVCTPSTPQAISLSSCGHVTLLFNEFRQVRDKAFAVCQHNCVRGVLINKESAVGDEARGPRSGYGNWRAGI